MRRDVCMRSHFDWEMPSRARYEHGMTTYHE